MSYIYTLHHDIKFTLPASLLSGAKSFNSQWLAIDAEEHTISVASGYSWDGCSPKLFSVLGLFWVGTPDGIPLQDGFTITGKASLLHDALYQFLGQHNLTRAQCDAIFAHQLQQDGFKLWWLYYGAVRLLGGVARWVYKKFFSK